LGLKKGLCTGKTFGNRRILMPVIPQSLAIKALRDSGYKTTSNALAELIDNSVQWGEVCNNKNRKETVVEVFCVNGITNDDGKEKLKEIAVFDNACGMSSETLRKALEFGNGENLGNNKDNTDVIGRFGMGLPNSSMNTCRKVEVYTWQNNQFIYSYLSLDDILEGKMEDVPKPTKKKIPEKWLKVLKNINPEHGTLVIWTELDLATWKRSSTLINHTIPIVGRIYRYYILQKKAKITFFEYSEKTNGSLEHISDEAARPNDPLFLEVGTCAPHPYDKEPAFELHAKDEYEIDRGPYKGSKIKMSFSISKQKPRDEGGDEPIGKHAFRNSGISVVRAGRELQLNTTFIKDPYLDRWFGVEISFSPKLDYLFGVSNNKQEARNFYYCDLYADAKQENMAADEFLEYLLAAEDWSSYLRYQLNTRIASNLASIRPKVKKMGEGKGKLINSKIDSIVPVDESGFKKDKKTTGMKGLSDEQLNNNTLDVNKREIAETLNKAEIFDPLLIDEVSQSKSNCFFYERDLSPSKAFFDVVIKGGKIFVELNTNHQGLQNLVGLIKGPDEQDSKAYDALRMLISAWARMEDVARQNEDEKEILENIREKWGRTFKNFYDAKKK
jgi:hypothetical protein